MSWSNLFFVSLFSAAGVFIGLAVGFVVVFAVATWIDSRELKAARRKELWLNRIEAEFEAARHEKHSR